MRADLLIVTDMAATRDILLVVKDGRVIVDRLGN